mgnify:CR=1 FL=1
MTETTERAAWGESSPHGETKVLEAIAISEHRTVADLTKSKEAAEVANYAKSVFLAQMNHELRTPLNAIIGFSDMMQQQVLGLLSERYREYAAHVGDSG